MVLSACSPPLQFAVPLLNEHDRQHLTCRDYPDIAATLQALPAHEWLQTSTGVVVVTPDGRRWVSFDVVNQREAALIRFATVDASDAHFECQDDLRWFAGVWTGLEAGQ